MLALFAKPVALRLFAFAVVCNFLLWPSALKSEPVRVRHQEGLLHGFLVLRALDGRKLADGEMTQVTKGDQLTDNLVFRFLDGSIYKAETVCCPSSV